MHPVSANIVLNRSEVSEAPPSEAHTFDRAIAFSRTLGLVAPGEMEILHNKTVAIAGLGGVGGSHLLTLTRLGIGGFHLADFDTFGQENFNRQAGANITTIGRKKLDVMIGLARQINPGLRIRSFPAGVTPHNVDDFLNGADVYVDGLDLFAFHARDAVFQRCYDRGIPALTAGPLGMGAALMIFLPGGMSFREYIDWQSTDSPVVKAIKLVVGLAPALPHRYSLVDRRFVDLANGKGPSVPMACELCAGFAGSQVLKLLLGRGPIQACPRSLHFDAYVDRLYARTVWMGNRNPWQKLKIAVTMRALAGKQPA